MVKPRVLFIGAWAFLSFLTSAFAEPTTWFVRSAGSDDADGRTPATAFRSVLRAGQALNHGERIVIGPGRYSATVFLGERFGTADAPIAVVGDESGKLTGDNAG